MGAPAQAVAHAVSHAVTNIANTVKTVVTNPAKANIGQIVGTVIPVVGLVPVDAAQHKEDRPILAAATAIAVGGAYALGATSATSATAAGTGAASTLGLVKSAAQVPAIVNAAETLSGGGGGGGGGGTPTTPPVFGPVAPPDFGVAGNGVWSTSDGGGSGNSFINPTASGTLSPVTNTMIYIIGGVFILLILMMSQKKGRG